jgi:fructose-1-phosphate kinase PfkB-like protein
MICIIAGNYLEAQRWAYGQQLEDSEWFYPAEPQDLFARSNFHVVVVGSAGQNIPPSYFERVFNLAHKRGRIGRDNN